MLVEATLEESCRCQNYPDTPPVCHLKPTSPSKSWLISSNILPELHIFVPWRTYLQLIPLFEWSLRL